MKLHVFLIHLIFSGCVSLFIISCETVPELEITDIEVGDVGETTASFSWQLSSKAYSSTLLSIYKQSDPAGSVRDFAIDGNSATTFEIDGLTGLTSYAYTISFLNDQSEELAVSDERTFKTSFTSEEVEMITRDSYTLKGSISYLSTWNSEVPGIIMMHELDARENPWQASETMEALISKGFACMVFFFRGHGTSNAFPSQEFLGPNAAFYLGCDVEAAIDCFKNHILVDSTKIGLMGGSLGAAASVIGNYFPAVVSSVALSTGTNAAFSMKEFFSEFEDVNLRSIYYIAGELDQVFGWNWPGMAMDLYSMTEDPRKLWIIPGSSMHGCALIGQTGLQDSLMT